MKRVAFHDMGKSGSMIRSRTTAWLCMIPQEDNSPSCCDLDEHWNMPKYYQAPGLSDVEGEVE